MKTYKELERENFVVINNELFEKSNQDKFGLESILVLSVIQQNLTVRGECLFNLLYIYEKLGIAKTNSTKQKQIKTVLSKLQDDKVIICDEDLSKVNNNMLVKVDISLAETNYTVIYDYELEAIINCGEENLHNLLNLFTFIKYRAGMKKYCYWNQSDIAFAIGMKSRKAISRMVDVLENELFLIKSDNVGNKKFKDGSVKQSNNMYAMNYEGVDELLKSKGLEYAKTLAEEGIAITKNENANEQRSIKGKINHLSRKYQDDTITEDEKNEMLSLEKKYYDIIKDDEFILEQKKDEFILLDIEEIKVEKSTPIKKKEKVVRTVGFGKVADEIQERKATVTVTSTVDNVDNIASDIDKFLLEHKQFTKKNIADFMTNEVSEDTIAELRNGSLDCYDILTINKNEIEKDEVDYGSVFEQSPTELRRNRAKMDEPESADDIFGAENRFTEDWEQLIS